MLLTQAMHAMLVAAVHTCSCTGNAAGVCRSRGAGVTDVIIFGIGNDWLARAACNAILIQGVGQYLVNLNIWDPQHPHPACPQPGKDTPLQLSR